MIRLLLDQGLAPAAAAMLRAAGFDAIHVADRGMTTADDLEILEYASAEARVCVTLDHDFHAHLATARRNGPSVVFLRVQGMNAEESCYGARTHYHPARQCPRHAVAFESRRLPLS